MKRVITFAAIILAMAALTPPVMSYIFAHLPDWRVILAGYIWTSAGLVMFACLGASLNDYSERKRDQRHQKYMETFR